mmetsp:Transcript_2766/g.9328  ORF Transcript_2766/g.9328 Transcript_2766/m.9328 type:complete len:108 (+) Transcript_2766:2655-2978(+)|eukprot:scaffold33407_cov112-Isochrysis_galbana.AAC.5
MSQGEGLNGTAAAIRKLPALPRPIKYKAVPVQLFNHMVGLLLLLVASESNDVPDHGTDLRILERGGYGRLARAAIRAASGSAACAAASPANRSSNCEDEQARERGLC